MANNQFINLEELSKTTQALLSKINEQSNLKVNKTNVSAEYSEGTKIAEIEDVEIYAPEIDTSNFITYDNLDLAQVAYSGSYNDLSNTPTFATVATSGSYNDLSNTPIIPILKVTSNGANMMDATILNKNFSIIDLFTISDGSGASFFFYFPNSVSFSSSPSSLKISGSSSYNLYINDRDGTPMSNGGIITPGLYTGSISKDRVYYFTLHYGIQVENARTVNSHTVASDVPANAVFTDTIYDDTTLAGRVSTLENAGYITSYTETDPTVPEWAKAQTKPSYTATEVGALPSSTTFVSSFNGNTGDITYTAPVTSVNGNTGTVVVDKLKLAASQNVTNYTVLGYNQTGSNENPQYIRDLSRLQFIQYTSNYARLILGDNKTPGVIRLYDNKANTGGYLDLKPTVQTTATREINFPDASGTVALTTDIPSVPSWALANNKPSYTFSELTSHPTTLNDYGITDAYTKTEVDGLVSGVLHYKGAKSTTSALPSSGNVTGDVWHVTADSSEWAWDGSEWQELGTTVDLSGYLQSSDISAWAKAANKPSYTASEVGALPSSTTYVSSFNGQSGAITYIPPVSSVNGQTGVVSLNIPDIPSWALASSKPSYTASEVGALPSSTTYVSSFNGSTGAITYTAPVASVNGQTGAVTLSIPSTPADIGAASATHAHGNITSGGDMTATAAIASGDRLVINDESASKLVSSTITFGSSTTQYLANNGTWQNVPATYDDTALAARVSALEQIPWVTYYTGSTTPSNSQGNNGDLYFQTAQ